MCIWHSELFNNRQVDFVLVQCCVRYFVTIICIVTLVGACGLKAINKILDLTIFENMHVSYWNSSIFTGLLLCGPY